MNKRLKSFGMVFGSVALSAFIALAPTVEFANFVQWVYDLAAKAGVPTVVTSLLAAFIAQMWFIWRNSVNEKKIRKGGYRTVSEDYTPY